MEPLADQPTPRKPDPELVEGIRRRITDNSDLDTEAEAIRHGLELRSCAILMLDRLAGSLRVAGISSVDEEQFFRNPKSIAIELDTLYAAGYTRTELHRLRVTTLDEYARLLASDETVELNPEADASERRACTMVQVPLFDSYRRLLGLLLMLGSPHEEVSSASLEAMRSLGSQVAHALEIRNSIYFDKLTELPNVDTIRPAIVDKLLSFEPFSLLLCKIINLDEIVLSKGDEFVDQCIIVVTQRIRDLARRQSREVLIGRNSGEGSFTFVYPDASEEELLAFSSELITAINEPIWIAGKSIRLVANIGICHSTDIDDTDMVFNYGKLALRAIADQQNQIQVFTAAMQHAYAKERELEQEIRDALAEWSFLPHYQPKVSGGGEIVGYEALARWNREGRIEHPSVFMSAIERMGVVNSLFEIMVAKVCEDLDRNEALSGVSINVSPVQVAEEDFPRRLASMLERWGADPARFTIEVVETAMLESTYYHVIEELKRLGLRVSLDDFGTGYARYKTLLDLFDRGLIDEVKIDKAFIEDIASPAGASFVKSMSYIAKEFDVAVVAEGVETLDQFARIASIAPDMLVQGWLVSPAKPLRELGTLDRDAIAGILTGRGRLE
jgi:EAL domain-containing protein (putative c-di-GMP-specific phosphodiesterase class I)/GGDEF domain-containing protein